MQNDMEQQLAGEIKLAHSFFPHKEPVAAVVAHHDSSRASSVFKHKLSIKLACVACVVDAPKETKQEP